MQFYNRSSGSILGEHRVVKVGRDQEGATTVHMEGSTFPVLDTGHVNAGDPNAATQVYNLNASATQFVFRRNKVTNGRRSRLGPIQEVEVSFFKCKNRGASLDCGMLSPRFIHCPTVREGSTAEVYFQPYPNDTAVFRVDSCNRCPGDVCDGMVPIQEAYFKTLQVAATPFLVK